MRRLSNVYMAMVLTLGAVLAGATVASAGDYECRGTLGAVTIVGNLLVPDDAACTLDGTNVQGTIVVKSRATLRATGVTATGGVQSQGPRDVIVRDSTLGNSVSVSKSEPGGIVEFTNTQITGDMQFEDNRGAVSLSGNEISGSIQANKNVGGLEITDNRIDNGLQCQDNNPPPTGSDNTAKQAQGQCQFLIVQTGTAGVAAGSLGPLAAAAALIITAVGYLIHRLRR